MKVTTPAEGIICESLAGRDKGNLYCVVRALDDFYVEVADGRSKKFSRPKKKNVKHLRFTAKKVTDYTAVAFDGKGVDYQLAFALKLCKKSLSESQTK